MFYSIPIHASISSKLCIDECTIALLSLLSHHEMFANVADPFWITCNVQSLMQNICKMHYTTHYSSLNPLLLLSGFLLVRIQVCLSYIHGKLDISFDMTINTFVCFVLNYTSMYVFYVSIQNTF